MSGAEFQYNVRAPVARAFSLLHELPLAIQGRSECAFSHMSQTKGSYGFGCPCPTSGPSGNEGVHEVGFIASFQPVMRLCTAALHHWKNAECYAHGTH